MTPRPKALIVNFPSNPTTECVDLPFLARLVELAREYGFYLIHDLAYADIAFDGYKPPSVLAGARRQRCRRRVLHPVEELQHARLAHRLHGRQPAAGLRARAAQELLRLRHLHAHPGRVHRRARRAAGVRRARSARTTARAATCWSRDSTRPAGRWPRPRRRCSSGRRFPSSTAASARWSSQSCCSPRPR